MADPQLKTLAKHCRNVEKSNRVRMLLLDTRLAADQAEAQRLTRENHLWLQLADEIDAYLNGNIEESAPNPDQLTIGGIG